MLLLARNLYGTSVDALDGKLGKLVDLLFDDQTWRVGHVVLDAGEWLHRRRVTLPPDMIEKKHWADHRVVTKALTRQQVIDSPGIETHVPVALHATLEEAMVTDWEVYWTNILSAGHPWQISDDPHVHNTQEVAGYHIEGNDGPIGHIADFVINDETWTIGQLVVDTRNWWPGKQVLVPTARTENIDGPNRTVRVMLSRENIQNSPSLKGLVTV